MAKIVRIEGSGITKTSILQLEVGTDLPMIVAATKHFMAMHSFAFTQQMTRSTAKNILRAYGLPTETRGVYVTEERSWKQAEGARSGPESYDSYLRVFEDLNIPRDSAPGYAAHVLVMNDRIADRMVDRSDEAFALAFQLGSLIKEAELKAAWEADAIRGEKIMSAADAGDVIAHGTKEHRERKVADLRKEFRALLDKGLKPMAAYRTIAARTGLSAKTVQRKITKK